MEIMLISSPAAPSDISIRPYRPEDFGRLCAIHDAARQDELRLSSLSAAFIPLSAAAEKEGLFDCYVSIAERNSAIEGFVAYTPHEITWLYVSPKAYRSGVGKALLRHALSRSGKEMMAEVLVGNVRALRFYQSLGFEIAETKNGTLAGNEKFNASAHVLRLKAIA